MDHLITNSPLTFVRRRWNPAGGAERYLQRLIQRLVQRGLECHLICESWDHQESGFSNVTELGRRSGLWGPLRFAQMVNMELSTRNSFVFSMERGVRCDLFRAGDGLHRMWLRHRATIHPLRGYSSWLNPKHAVQRYLEDLTFKAGFARRIIANSEMVRREILSTTPFLDSDIHVIPNAVDADYFGSGSRKDGRRALGLSDSDHVILLVGRGAERKGHREARYVVDRLSTSARLVLIDSPPTCPMPDVYAAADLFLLPTLYDPFASVTLEAMAAGLPVITTRQNGASQEIEQGITGWCVSRADSYDEMIPLCNALFDPDLRHTVGQNAQRHVASLSWDIHLESTLALMPSSPEP